MEEVKSTPVVKKTCTKILNIINILLFIGCMLVNIVPESVAGWRSIALLGAMLTVPLIITTIIVSESPFYLLKSG